MVVIARVHWDINEIPPIPSAPARLKPRDRKRGWRSLPRFAPKPHNARTPIDLRARQRAMSLLQAAQAIQRSFYPRLTRRLRLAPNGVSCPPQDAQRNRCRRLEQPPPIHSDPSNRGNR